MNGLKDMYNLISSANTRGLNIARLDSTDVSALQAIATNPQAGIAAQKAKNTLCFHYQICYDAQGNQNRMERPASLNRQKRN